MGEERELYEIRHQMECIFDVLQRLAAAAERLIPEGSERERIAMSLFVQNSAISTEDAFDQADLWIAERDRQRAQQAEQRRAE